MKITTNCTVIPFMRLANPAPGGVLLQVDENELAYFTQEGYADGGPGKGEHRYQALFIPRNDLICVFWTDLGPRSDFIMAVDGVGYAAPPYFQPIIMCHTVGECRYMADHARMDDYAAKLLNEQVNTSDLFARYEQLIQEDMQRVKNASVFGPGGSTQRNGFSRLGASEAALRQSERQQNSGRR